MVAISLAHQVDVHVFSDASEHAIAAVAYLQVTDEFGETSLGFLMGKSKLAPLKGHTIPRLELCAAVLATELGEAVCDYLKIPQDRFHYYTDSRIVLGYICNKTRRFVVYVTNRVEKSHTKSRLRLSGLTSHLTKIQLMLQQDIHIQQLLHLYSAG